MAVWLSAEVYESSVDVNNNTSVVTVNLYANTNYGSFNHYSPYGYINIDGAIYEFWSGFNANTTTLLASRSRTIAHNEDGSRSVGVYAYFQTGVSSGNIEGSWAINLTHIQRKWTVSYNANGGTGAPSSQTKNYGSTLALSSTEPTRPGYIFKGWATSATGSAVYQPGDSYTANAAVTLYAVWQLGFIAPVIRSLVAFRVDVNNIPDDEGQNVGITVVADKAKEYIDGEWVDTERTPTITLKIGSRNWDPTTNPFYTSGLLYDIEHEYNVELTASYTYQGIEFKATKKSYVSRAIFTFDTNEIGSAVGLGRAAPDENYGVWQGTYLNNVKGTLNLKEAVEQRGHTLDDLSMEEMLSDAYSGTAYSTSETLTGERWVDGKPIYRTVYNNVTMNDASASWHVFGSIPENLETAVRLYGTIRETNGNFKPVPYYETTSHFVNLIVGMASDPTGVAYKYSANGGTVVGRIILEYTKTTD